MLRQILQIGQGETVPVVLAPMAGITDFAFREVCRDWGADMTYSEMISAKGLKYNSKRTFEIADLRDETKSAIQLFGRDPQDIANAIRVLQQEQAGCISCFDINMGCPAPKIVNNGEGSALMKEPELAAEIVAAAKKVSEVAVTVKFRRGFDKTHGDAVSFAQRMEQAGADAVTIHGRLREEYYTGKADWDCIARTKQLLSIPVIANGDVFSPEDAKGILDYTGADGVMVARGATGNPFLFSQIKTYLQTGTYRQISNQEKLQTVLKQAELCVKSKGEHRAMQEFRKHIAWYLKGVRGAAALRQQALGLNTLEQLQSLAMQVFGDSTTDTNMI